MSYEVPCLDLETSDIGASSSTLSDELEYPCLILDGEFSREEVLYYKNLSPTTISQMALFIRFKGVTKFTTYVDFNKDFMFRLNIIGESDYKLTLCKSKDSEVAIDYTNPDTLLKLLQFDNKLETID